ncbi:hypothetical protein Bca4012_090908 [Brassica carinata]|uniref:(rape) hypothetical protein n=1 Tax=Brassica napus TaxID=3708 RepID=A0A078GGD7_BRANA|nr:unnamed protein product [Brassica napus]CDY24222.1 BnaC01g38020D [Brassica napus]
MLFLPVSAGNKLSFDGSHTHQLWSLSLSPNVSVSASFLAVHFSIHTSRFIRLFTQ